MQSLSDIYEQKIQQGGLRADPDQARVIGALDTLSRSLAPPASKAWWPFARKKAPKIKGLYLWGGVGRGKSMLMDMFFAQAPVENKRRVHFHAFMLEVHDFLFARRSHRTEQDRIDSDLIAAADKIAGEARLLCFDEFQVKDVADAMIIGRLFTALFERGVVVVMTSNIPPDGLYKDGLQRDRFLPFIELLKSNMEVYAFIGETDYRRGRLRELDVYFWPADADAHAQLDRVFTTVTDGDAGNPADITVKGRIIHVPRAAKGVAAFSFSELCEQPKSALDYLELTRLFRFFIIKNIPRLNDGNRDAVTRFVTLIDALYDSHAFVAVSAAAPPEELYDGTALAQVFERTVSRLLEMQSRSYRES
ncbi:MAG TPA: cell division protein ZapE [Patescibacteria group bacterium]|nr:cell division protein ZapE [Patescibacteria group bacterium]